MIYRLQRERFEGDNPGFSWPRTEQRFRDIFLELQQAWTTRDWERARPHETDNLFQSHRYWIEEYRRQDLTNVLKNIRIEDLIPVKITQDAFYDAITVRIFAAFIDYTVDGSGKTVCGSSSRERRFSEYWTFIRRKGVKESDRAAANCPNCGADLKINMAGICEYCESKVTRGDFDWVLSRIEQDESYAG